MISEHMKPLVAGNSAIRAMFEEGRRMAGEFGAENVYDFSLGNPNVPAPKEVNEAIVDIIENEDSHKVHGYMPNAGHPEVRKAVADNLNGRYGTDYTAENVIMTVGAGSALNVMLKTILDPDDEVIVFAPYFVEYRSYISNYYGKTVELETTGDEGFMPDPDKLASLINERTKAVIINNPNNPTGVIYPADVIAKLAGVLLAKEKEIGHSIYLISDEPYREIAYDGARVPWLPDFYQNTIIGYSFSKSLSLPGERIGYVLVPSQIEGADEFIAAATIANRVSGDVNAPSLIQLAVARCLDAKVDVDFYRKNRDLLLEIMDLAGFEYVKPEGAFYLWVKSPVDDDKEFVQAGKKEHILMVPGSSFAGPGYVRLSYCVSKDMILRSKDAFLRLGEAFK
ncbi:MAG: pyridoxal phosphate-dependent aminotransferase [Eubacteriales bacterium]|nr:pyridoxal phosphate-dependent aminotransferase [Eubacteriales bacterium]